MEFKDVNLNRISKSSSRIDPDKNEFSETNHILSMVDLPDVNSSGVGSDKSKPLENNPPNPRSKDKKKPKIILEDEVEDLINENGASVQVVRGWMSKSESSSLLTFLREEIPWAYEPISIYGKTVNQPRRTFSCGDEGVEHYYSGFERVVTPWIPEIERVKDLFVSQTSIAFNSCLLNEYKDGSSYIGYHSDKETKPPNNAVATLSLGGSRDFYFKDKKNPSRPRIETTLHHGDAVLMFGRTQELFTHSIPKRAKGEYRISLTFRELE